MFLPQIYTIKHILYPAIISQDNKTHNNFPKYIREFKKNSEVSDIYKRPINLNPQ